MTNQKSSGSTLLAAVSALGLSLGVAPATQAQPAPRPAGCPAGLIGEQGKPGQAGLIDEQGLERGGQAGFIDEQGKPGGHAGLID